MLVITKVSTPKSTKIKASDLPPDQISLPVEDGNAYGTRDSFLDDGAATIRL